MPVGVLRLRGQGLDLRNPARLEGWVDGRPCSLVRRGRLKAEQAQRVRPPIDELATPRARSDAAVIEVDLG